MSQTSSHSNNLSIDRRSLLQRAVIASAGLAGVGTALLNRSAQAARFEEAHMQFGLVTYLWGKDMDLPTLLKNCEASGLLGVELRTEHKHAWSQRCRRANVWKSGSVSPTRRFN